MMMKRRSKAIAFFVAIMMTIVQLVILPANGIEAKVTYVVDAVPSTLHIAERSPSEIRQFIASHPVQYLTTESRKSL